MIKLILTSLVLFLCAMTPAYAQSATTFENVEPCRDLQAQIASAVKEAEPIRALLQDENVTTEQYLEQLYQAVQILSKSGEQFFKASDMYESACQTALTQAGRLSEMRQIYDWYLDPVKQAYLFFARAKAVAIHHNRQQDVETFVKSMREYEDSVMKIAATCESTLAGTETASSCRILASKLEDALKIVP